jgi:hypothetical protein
VRGPAGHAREGVGDRNSRGRGGDCRDWRVRLAREGLRVERLGLIQALSAVGRE